MKSTWQIIKPWAVPVIWMLVGAGIASLFGAAFGPHKFVVTTPFQIPSTYLNDRQKVTGTVSEGASILLHGRKADSYYVSVKFALDSKEFQRLTRESK